MSSAGQQVVRDERISALRADYLRAETAPEYPQASYNRARYFDQNSGRFLAEDPVRFDAGPNFYNYVRNNPDIFDMICKILPVVLSRQAVSRARLKLRGMKKATIRKPPLDLHGETLGQRLARLRTQHGYTQVEFAGKVGITQVLVSSYETDRRQFSVEMAIRFALALDISTDELLHPKAKKISSKKPSRRVMRRVEEIEKLPPYDQRALLTTIDKFIATAQDR